MPRRLLAHRLHHASCILVQRKAFTNINVTLKTLVKTTSAIPSDLLKKATNSNKVVIVSCMSAAINVASIVGVAIYTHKE